MAQIESYLGPTEFAFGSIKNAVIVGQIYGVSVIVFVSIVRGMLMHVCVCVCVFVCARTHVPDRACVKLTTLKFMRAICKTLHVRAARVYGTLAHSVCCGPPCKANGLLNECEYVCVLVCVWCCTKRTTTFSMNHLHTKRNQRHQGLVAPGSHVS